MHDPLKDRNKLLYPFYRRVHGILSPHTSRELALVPHENYQLREPSPCEVRNTSQWAIQSS